MSAPCALVDSGETPQYCSTLLNVKFSGRDPRERVVKGILCDVAYPLP